MATPFNIDEFRNHYSDNNEVSKSDKFDVYILVPSLVAEGVTTKDLALQCEVSEMPGKDIQMIEYRHYGFTHRIPHMNQYNHINFTFYCTGDLIEKRLFDRWMDIMIPAASGLVMYPQDDNGVNNYETRIQINQYDNQGYLAYAITLIDAVPTSVSPLSQSWADDSVHRLNVSFAYRKWESSETKYNNISDFNNVSAAFPATTQLGSTMDGVNNYTNINQSLPRDLRVPYIIPAVLDLGGRFGIVPEI